MPPVEPAPVAHVLMTADAVGGVWTYALDLSRALAEHDVRVSLAVMGPAPRDAQREEVAAIPTVSFFERTCALEWMDDPWREVDEAGEWLIDLERQLRPDIVHLNGYCHARCDWQAPVLVAGHSCVLSWWRAVHGTDAPAQWDEYAARVGEGLRAADLVVAPTAAMLASLQYHYGSLARSRVILNGRSAYGVTPEPATKEAIVLTAGRLWDQAKNVESVVSVASFLQWPVFVAGESRRGDDRMPSHQGAHYLGRLGSRELGVWMRRAAVYALPVRYEPFGLSILEAALAGCAVVVGDIRSQREIWGDAAVYVPADNRRALASTLDRLARDDEHRYACAARAGARARELTPRRMAEAYLAAYRELLHERVPLTIA